MYSVRPQFPFRLSRFALPALSHAVKFRFGGCSNAEFSSCSTLRQARGTQSADRQWIRNQKIELPFKTGRRTPRFLTIPQCTAINSAVGASGVGIIGFTLGPNGIVGGANFARTEYGNK
jgi:hypothetical protein